VITLPGHTPGSVGYLLADRGLLFTGDALVNYDGITGYRGPTVVSRAFTHDSRAALTSLTALGTIDAGLLPGHGEPFRARPSSARDRVSERDRCRDRGAGPLAKAADWRSKATRWAAVSATVQARPGTGTSARESLIDSSSSSVVAAARRRASRLPWIVTAPS
jgi:glyoxylase-like metal-dependent hydrolase (beta-lactamase superfamily II)